LIESTELESWKMQKTPEASSFLSAGQIVVQSG